MDRCQDDYGNIMDYYRDLNTYVQPYVKTFESDVYLLGGMLDQICASRCSGMHTVGEDLRVDLCTTGGRTMLTLSDGVTEVTMVCAAEAVPPRMGIHSIHGSRISEAIALLNRALTVKWGDLEDDPNLRVG